MKFPIIFKGNFFIFFKSTHLLNLHFSIIYLSLIYNKRLNVWAEGCPHLLCHSSLELLLVEAYNAVSLLLELFSWYSPSKPFPYNKLFPVKLSLILNLLKLKIKLQFKSLDIDWIDSKFIFRLGTHKVFLNGILLFLVLIYAVLIVGSWSETGGRGL